MRKEFVSRDWRVEIGNWTIEVGTNPTSNVQPPISKTHETSLDSVANGIHNERKKRSARLCSLPNRC